MPVYAITTLLILLLFLSGLATANDRPRDARNVVISGSASVSHTAGDEYGGEGLTEAAFDAIVAVFVLNHFAVGAMTSVRDNQPWDWRDNWSVGPVIALYADPNAGHPEVQGSALPFVRAFGLFGKTELYEGNTTYAVGGDIGFAIMAGEHLSIDIAMRASHEWIVGVNRIAYDNLNNAVIRQESIKSRTVRLTVGLSGFID